MFVLHAFLGVAAATVNSGEDMTDFADMSDYDNLLVETAAYILETPTPPLAAAVMMTCNVNLKNGTTSE